MTARRYFRLYLDRAIPFVGPFTLMIDDALTNLTVGMVRGEVKRSREFEALGLISRDEIYVTEFRHHPAYAFSEDHARELTYEAIIGRGISASGGRFDA